jgi:hypothetical protein
MTKEDIEEAGARLEEIVGKNFHDVLVSVLEVPYWSEDWEVSDDEIRAIKDELIELLKQ